MVNRTKMWERYTRSPAVQSTLQGMDRNYFRKGNVQAELLGRKVQNYVNPKNIVETLRVMADGIETSARLGDFIIGYRKMAKEI